MKTISAAVPPNVRVIALTWWAILVLGAASVSAQVSYESSVDQDSGKDLGFYFAGDLGPSFVPNFQSSRFGFQGNFSLEPGFRLGVEPGYNFFSNGRFTLGAEFETGVIYNYINSVTEGGSSTDLHGYFYQVPLLGNLVLNFHPNSFITPYVGVGGGGDISVATLHSGFYGFRTTDSQIDPAVQGMAGVRFRINSFCDVGLSYKFLADFPNEGQYIGTHTVFGSFTLKF